MPRRLTIVESGCRRDDLVRILESTPDVDGASLLVEELADADFLRGRGFSPDWIQELVTSRDEIRELSWAARRLFEKALAFVEASKAALSLQVQGVSLLSVGRLYIETTVLYRSMVALRVLERIISEEPDTRVLVLGRSGSLESLAVLAGGHERADGRVESRRLPADWGGKRGLSRAMRDLSRRGVAGFGLELPYLAQALSRRLARRSTAAAGRRPGSAALFVTDGHYLRLGTVAPIVEKVKRNGPVTIAPHDWAHQLSETFDAADIWDWLDSVSLFGWLKVARECRQTRRAWRRLVANREFQATFDFEGRRLWTSIEPRLSGVLPNMMFPQFASMLHAAGRLFAAGKVRSVLSSEQYMPLSRVCMSLGRRHGIPSLVALPTVSDDYPLELVLDLADRVCVLDDDSRRAYTQVGGVGPERVVVTGTPRWDEIVRRARLADPARGRERLGLGVSDRLVVFATQPTVRSEMDRIARALGRVVSARDGCRLVLKVHPRESVEAYRALAAELEASGARPVLVGETDLPGLISACEVLVTGFSNVAMEAAIANRAVVTVNLTGEADPIPYAANGVALAARSEEEIEKTVGILLDDPEIGGRLATDRRLFFAKNPQLVDMKSAERVAALLPERR